MDQQRRRRTAGVPSALWRRPVRVLRPRDAAFLYKDPPKELARLARQGLMTRIAPGYFALVPPERVGADPAWKAPLVDAGWGIAAADYGIDAVAVCGPSAARHHGLIPRASATAYVAVPKQRPHVRIGDGEVSFTKRDVRTLDVERIRTQLGDGWTTSLEQTVLDLAARPERWRIPSAELEHCLAAARSRLDSELLREIAGRQHRPGALARVLA